MRRIWVEKYELTTYRYDVSPADYAAEDKPFDTLAEDTAYEDYPPLTLHQFKAVSKRIAQPVLWVWEQVKLV